DTVRETAQASGGGPLLELPHSTRPVDQREAMLGAVRHGLPLVTGYTGYPAAHYGLLEATVMRLPADDALTALVDMTHLRWLLLHPPEMWPADGSREAILALPGVRVMAQRDGWVLARVDRAPQRREWFDAIAGGGVPLMAMGRRR